MYSAARVLTVFALVGAVALCSASCARIDGWAGPQFNARAEIASVQSDGALCASGISRNSCVTLKMAEIDAKYHDYVHNWKNGDVWLNLFGDLTVLGLNTAGATIPVAQTTKLLASAATAIGGAKTVYNQDVLKAQTWQVLQKQMDTDRASVSETILARLAKCDGELYPFGLIISDLESYAQAGTIDSALASLVKSADAAQPIANAGTRSAAKPASAVLVGSDVQITRFKGGTLKYQIQRDPVICPLQRG